ncbi:MAG: flavodoxin family protein [Lachnospiraceae bacterium]|nr:flavodoxin family protein [Lachnospiraceae bacterium]
MKTIIHDLNETYEMILKEKCQKIISANGKYAPCQGCFGCWTKHPAGCYMKDTLETVCRDVGKADELMIITENCYGAYSPSVKNVLDRSIGLSTPFSTYRGRQMHHTLRYGKREKLTVYAYGDMTDAEKETFRYMVERNAINFGFKTSEFRYLESLDKLEGIN